MNSGMQGVWAALALTWAGAANATPHVITNPDWLSKPDGAEMAKLYPPIADAFVLDGRAIVSCEVTEAGLMEKCVSSNETPPGIGFGPAVIEAAKLFRTKPKTIDGQPVAGGTVRIPLHFIAPPHPELSVGESYVPPTVTPQDLEFGRRLVARLFEKAGFDSFIDGLLVKDFGPKPDGVDEATAHEALAILRSNIREAMPILREAVAREYAAEYSQQQIAKFLAAPLEAAGKNGGRLSVQLKDTRVVNWVLASTLAKARSQFCLKRDCSVRFGM
jgi:TonB family protein